MDENSGRLALMMLVTTISPWRKGKPLAWIACIVLIFIFLLPLRADDKKKASLLYTKPGQTADLDAGKLITAKQDCENWALAAGLESMLKRQEVALDQNFWVMRISGGEVCSPEIPKTEVLTDVVNREFVLESGRHVQLELHYLAGAPANSDALIAGLKKQQLSLLLFRGHVYYLTGATYDEYINRDGSRTFVLTELRLANTFGHQPGLAFIKGRDDMAEIGGIINVNATPMPIRW